MIALVTGATGCVGRALIRQLIASNRFMEIRALVRGSAADLLPECRIVAGDLSDLNVLREACRNVDVVFHAAAKVHDAQGDPAVFEEVNVRGTKRLLRACEESSVPRFLFLSTVAVYGEDTSAEGLAEDAPPAPVSAYAKTKLQGEQLVRDWAERNGTIGVLLRLATVYGPHDRGNMARMMTTIQKGRFVLPGDGENKKTCVSVDNAALVLLLAATEPVPGGVPIVVADAVGAYRLRDLALVMAEAIGAPRSHATRSLPRGLLFLAADLLGIAAKLLKKNGAIPISRAQIERLGANNIYFPKRMFALLGNSSLSSLSEEMKKAAKDLLSASLISRI